jgi:hypothetical protein
MQPTLLTLAHRTGTLDQSALNIQYLRTVLCKGNQYLSVVRVNMVKYPATCAWALWLAGISWHACEKPVIKSSTCISWHGVGVVFL